MTFTQASISLAGLIAGNLLYQLGEAAPNWVLATERSWFQMVAILLAWVMWRKAP